MIDVASAWRVPKGTEVVSLDGEKVGAVQGAADGSIIVEHGWLFADDSAIPFHAIADFDGERLILNVTKDEAIDRRWNAAPWEQVDERGTPASTGAGGTSIPSVGGAGWLGTDARRPDSPYGVEMDNRHTPESPGEY